MVNVWLYKKNIIMVSTVLVCSSVAYYIYKYNKFTSHIPKQENIEQTDKSEPTSVVKNTCLNIPRLKMPNTPPVRYQKQTTKHNIPPLILAEISNEHNSNEITGYMIDNNSCDSDSDIDNPILIMTTG